MSPPVCFYFNKYVLSRWKSCSAMRYHRRAPEAKAQGDSLGFFGATPQGPRHDWSEQLRTKCRSRRHREAQLRFRRLSRRSGWQERDDDMRYSDRERIHVPPELWEFWKIMFLTQKCRPGGFFLSSQEGNVMKMPRDV